jgi:protoheme IX farnesyltransferase
MARRSPHPEDAVNPTPTRTAAAEPEARTESGTGWRAYAELTKPRLTSLVLVTTALGYLLAQSGPWEPATFAAALLGTALVGGGANGLNQWWESAADARMRRTRGRPFPSGRVSPRSGFAFALGLSASGLVLLLQLVNPLTAGLALLSWATYLLAYTPLKQRTTLNTLVGAVSGAVPPMMGWTAATGALSAGAWVLFAILFIWQIPHFLAIAWVHRADYARGGFRMLPVLDPDGRATFRIAFVYCLGLLPATWAAALVGLTGWFYLAGATVLGLGMLHAGLRLCREGSETAAKHLFLASIAYLPVLLLLMLLDPTRLPGGRF